jgi:hypothetical protein
MQEPDKERRADLGLALVFAEKTHCEEKWKKALEGYNVTESKQVKEWQAEALDRGLSQGRVQGIIQGRAEMLLDVLAGRLDAVPEDLAQRIRSSMETSVLHRWMQCAIKAATLEEFRREAGL